MLGLAPETLMLGCVLVPFLAALVIPLFDRSPNLREAVTLIAAAALALMVWSLVPEVLAGKRPQMTLTPVSPGLVLGLKAEPLGMLFALVAGSLWLVNSIYSIGYMRANQEPRQTRFYICFAIALASTMGVAFAENLFTLFLFYEALTLSTYPLVTHNGTPEAVKAGRTYLVLLIGSSTVLLLPAIIATGVLAGTLDFRPGGILDGKAANGMLGLLLTLYLFGIGKAAVMPFHFWLPAAMVAPTPVSALLHAVAVVKAGVFTVLKVIVMIFGVDVLARAATGPWLEGAAGATVILASLVALRQDNLKKRLAYSTVSQLSYVILGAAILTPVSVIGAAMHIAGHAVAKITLFFAAGSIYTAAHKTEISELDGIGWKMPWTMTAFAIGALGMIGVPLTSGFLGKWFMLQGGVETAQWLPVGVIVASTLLNATYFLPIVFRAFFGTPQGARLHAAGAAASPHAHLDHGEAPLPIVIALSITAIATILIFFFPDVLWALARQMMEP